MDINDFEKLAKMYEKQINDLKSRLDAVDGGDAEYEAPSLLENPMDEEEECMCECGEEDCLLCFPEDELEERNDLDSGGAWDEYLKSFSEEDFEPDEDEEYDEDLYSGVELGIPDEVFLGSTSRGDPGKLLDSGYGLYIERAASKKKGKM